MTRLPKGYGGKNHETIGSDILSVLKVVSFPERVLGEELTKKANAVTPEGWYPIDDLLQMMDRIDKAIGRAGLVQMGRNIFRLSHEEAAKKVLHTAGDIVYGLDGMYHHANRGEDIGGWKVIEHKPGLARLEKNTPHHCVMEEGILMEAMRMVGVPVMVTQTDCFRQGAPLCIYKLTSVITDEKWMGGRQPTG
jgi:hypothetical protein